MQIEGLAQGNLFTFRREDKELVDPFGGQIKTKKTCAR
jgi:hypothetical protein